MQINRSNMAFASRINFVTDNDFSDRTNTHNAKFIWCSLKEPPFEECDEFYSVQLRSCTGGGLVKFASAVSLNGGNGDHPRYYLFIDKNIF